MSTILSSLPPVDFTEYGPMGTLFQRQFDLRMDLLATGWERLQGLPDEQLPPLDVALREYMDSASTLFGILIGMSIPIARTQQARVCWNNSIRHIFTPAARSAVEMSHLQTYVTRRQLLTAFSAAHLGSYSETLNVATFGPYTKLDMAFLRANGRPLIEIGCGGGYFIAVCNSQGIDAVGYDNDAYTASSRSLPWTDQMRAVGKLKIAKADIPGSEFAGRTLVISWPPPGSSMPFHALRRYTEFGGQQFFFRLGGFIAPGGAHGGNFDNVPLPC